MATRTFYSYVRINGVLTNADSVVTLRVRDQSNNYLIGSASTSVAMTNISAGTYEYVSADLFTVGVTYTAIYFATINGNIYSYSENFTVDSASNQLFSLSELKQELKITTTDYDTVLALIVDAVPDMFEKYIDHKINVGINQQTEYKKNPIYLYAYPVSAINEVLVNSATTSYTLINGNFGELELTDLDTDDNLPEDGEPVVITYTGGMVPTPSLKYAGLIQAKYMYQRNQFQHIAIDEMTGQNQMRTKFKNEAILPLVKMILQPLINPNSGIYKE